MTQVVDDQALVATADALAARLAAAPTAAIGAARSLLLDGATSSLRDHLDREAPTVAAAGGHSELREGVAAFLARCEPDFQRAWL